MIISHCISLLHVGVFILAGSRAIKCLLCPFSPCPSHSNELFSSKISECQTSSHNLNHVTIAFVFLSYKCIYSYIEFKPHKGRSRMLLLLLSRFSRVRLCATPWTAAHQAALSLGFSRQEHRTLPNCVHVCVCVAFCAHHIKSQ